MTPIPVPGLPTPPAEPPHRVSARARLRNYFLTGLVVAGPLTITIYLTWWFINLVDGWVKPLIPRNYLPDTYLPFAIPGFGLIIAFFGLTLLGFATANLVGRSLLSAGELLLERMPVVRGLYRGVKQVFETLFSTTGTSFRTAGLIEFPVKGTWSIVFLSAPPSAEITDRLPDASEHVSVFLPCTPNPTTGFFFYLPRREVIELDMSVDDAAKLVMSAGLIQPETLPRRVPVETKEREAAL
ncbi:MAG TPA: DUF502 domain-containing protein [Salinarimonas sp.]|jgi:uncharacterized membrane protein|nr:DUF502 domain-containing protein [Salinarimonas sp.]